MSAYLLLLLYSLLIIAASLFGGWLPSRIKLSHTRVQLVMSFVAGLMLGVSVYHLLPHALAYMPEELGIDAVVWWLMLGLLSMFLLLRTFHFHQHDFTESGHDHDHFHGGECEAHQHTASGRFGWVGVAVGMGVHTLIDGLALGAAIEAERALGGTGLLGLGVFLAVLLHKPLDALSVTSLMVVSGWSNTARRMVNIGFAAMCPLGAGLFILGVGDLDGQAKWTAIALAFSAGAFLCIALSDLLPEIQFHSHDRVSLTLALVLGIAVAWGIGKLEPESAHAGHVASANNALGAIRGQEEH